MANEAFCMPLLGDSFPQLDVKSTHGPIHLPDDMK